MAAIKFFSDTDGNGQTLTNWLGAGGGGASLDNNEEILTGDKTLTGSDATIQVLNPDGTLRNVIMPVAPASDMYFVVINDSDGLSANGNTLQLREVAAGPIIVTLDDTTGLSVIRVIYTGAKFVWF